jgi:broad specificity phosphatase PhoE
MISTDERAAIETSPYSGQHATAIGDDDSPIKDPESSMAAIYLIRHAQASFATGNYDRLSARGHEQARLLGEYLAYALPTLRSVHCGTLIRQMETAQAILEARRGAGLDAPAIEADVRLNELDVDNQFSYLIPRMADPDGELRVLLGQARSSSRAYQKLLRRVYAHWQDLAEGIEHVESWNDFAARVRAAVRDIVRKAVPGGNAIVVTSGGVIATIAQQVLRLPKQGAYPLFEALWNCSISQLLHDRERLSLASYNECSYLRVLEKVHGKQALVTFR